MEKRRLGQCHSDKKDIAFRALFVCAKYRKAKLAKRVSSIDVKGRLHKTVLCNLPDEMTEGGSLK